MSHGANSSACSIRVICESGWKTYLVPATSGQQILGNDALRIHLTFKLSPPLCPLFWSSSGLPSLSFPSPRFSLLVPLRPSPSLARPLPLHFPPSHPLVPLPPLGVLVLPSVLLPSSPPFVTPLLPSLPSPPSVSLPSSPSPLLLPASSSSLEAGGVCAADERYNRYDYKGIRMPRCTPCAVLRADTGHDSR
ncbi:hypothetical protein DFH06DRAFT_1338905 [Mycena polygramma]|nr:hypothetical protein DFH06DRAFT_1338905 [Mycena polygramma]